MRVGMMSMLFWGNFWMGLFVVSGEDMHAALWGRAAGGSTGARRTPRVPETSNLMMRVGMMSMLFWGNFWMGLFVVSGKDMHAALWGRAAGGSTGARRTPRVPETSNLMRVGMMSMLFWGSFWMGLFVVTGEDMHAALWGRAAGPVLGAGKRSWSEDYFSLSTIPVHLPGELNADIMGMLARQQQAAKHGSSRPGSPVVVSRDYSPVALLVPIQDEQVFRMISSSARGLVAGSSTPRVPVVGSQG